MDRKSPVLEPLISNSKSQTLAVDHVAHAISTTQTTPPPDRRPGGHTPESDAEREVDGRTDPACHRRLAWPGAGVAQPRSRSIYADENAESTQGSRADSGYPPARRTTATASGTAPRTAAAGPPGSPPRRCPAHERNVHVVSN